jgi:hypothetical protein
MQWDIDKALVDLTAPGFLLEKSITMAVLTQDVWKQYGIKPNVDPTKREVMAWCLALGRYNGPKLITYALTIREAYLKMRRVIKDLDQEETFLYGVKGKAKKPEKRNGHS